MYGVFQKIGELCERKQRQLCEHLNRKTKGLSVRQLKAGLVIFCMLYMGCIAVVLVQVFQRGADAIRVESIKVPTQIPEKDTLGRFKEFFEDKLK